VTSRQKTSPAKWRALVGNANRRRPAEVRDTPPRMEKQYNLPARLAMVANMAIALMNLTVAQRSGRRDLIDE
jgi:hypothetical protein